MADPYVTVAVPTCNGARHLREALESVLRSTVPFDLIVVDDRSDDDTLAIARATAGDRARVVVNPERLGLAGNWNRCVELSTTPVVSIFHQDDLMLPGHLETHVEAHRANPKLGWVASNADVIDDAGRPIPESVIERGGLGEHDRDFADENGEGVFDRGKGIPELAVGNPLRCSAVTISRQAHAQEGGFDSSYQYVVDWDFWARVAEYWPVAWRARTTAVIRWHASSETHRFARGIVDLDETSRLIDEMVAGWNQGTIDDRWPEGAERRLARAYLNRAHVAFKAGDHALARLALSRALRLAPDGTSGHLARDPRLFAQMVASFLSLLRWPRRS